MFTKEQLIEQIREMGVVSTDTVVIHTSMRAIGEVDGRVTEDVAAAGSDALDLPCGDRSVGLQCLHLGRTIIIDAEQQDGGGGGPFGRNPSRGSLAPEDGVGAAIVRVRPTQHLRAAEVELDGVGVNDGRFRRGVLRDGVPVVVDARRRRRSSFPELIDAATVISAAGSFAIPAPGRVRVVARLGLGGFIARRTRPGGHQGHEEQCGGGAS